MKKIKKLSILLLVILLMVTTVSYIIDIDREIKEAPVEDSISESSYQNYLDHISSGGPPKDGIPPIESPLYISIEDAMPRMDAYDKVFVFESKHDTYLYPQNILVWHEIVNDVIDGEHLSITYCPLTGSTICYLGDIDQLENNTYGTSGKLLNSNLVMYDRATDSFIPQILGIGINNDLEGISLKSKAIHWANWEDAILAYPTAKVLSDETGFLRDYKADPYGTYQPEDNKSYYVNDGIMFPLINQHEGLYSDKKVVVGIKGEETVTAIDPMKVRSEEVLHFTIGSENAVAFWDKALKTVRIYKAEYEGERLTFTLDGSHFKDQLGRQWSIKGKNDDLGQLSSFTYFDVMWFAWYAYYPETEVIK